MRTQIRKIGNSLGSIIPSAFIRQLHLEEGAEISVTEQGGKIVIEPVQVKKKRFPFSEEDLTADMTPYTAHADELATISGKEIGE